VTTQTPRSVDAGFADQQDRLRIRAGISRHGCGRPPAYARVHGRRLRAMAPLKVVEAATVARLAPVPVADPWTGRARLGLPDGSGLTWLLHLRERGWRGFVVLSAAGRPLFSARRVRRRRPRLPAEERFGDGRHRRRPQGAVGRRLCRPVRRSLLATGLRGTGSAEGLAAELLGPRDRGAAPGCDGQNPTRRSASSVGSASNQCDPHHDRLECLPPNVSSAPAQPST